jgi:hypothetical protein
VIVEAKRPDIAAVSILDEYKYRLDGRRYAFAAGIAETLTSWRTPISPLIACQYDIANGSESI